MQSDPEVLRGQRHVATLSEDVLQAFAVQKQPRHGARAEIDEARGVSQTLPPHRQVEEMRGESIPLAREKVNPPNQSGNLEDDVGDRGGMIEGEVVAAKRSPFNTDSAGHDDGITDHGRHVATLGRDRNGTKACET